MPPRLPRCPKCERVILSLEQLEFIARNATPEQRVSMRPHCTCNIKFDVAAHRREHETVYFIGNIAAGYVKVGYSLDPPARIAEIAAYLPFDIETFAVLPGPMKLERAIHRHLRAWRTRGEWFKASPEVVAFFELASSGRLQQLFSAWYAKASPRQALDIADLLQPPPLARLKNRR